MSDQVKIIQCLCKHWDRYECERMFNKPSNLDCFPSDDYLEGEPCECACHNHDMIECDDDTFSPECELNRK